MAEDLNQYVGRGIPLIKLLAEQFGVAESEVRKLVEQGKVGFPQVEKAINKLTDSGGMFAGLMEEQSKGLSGVYSNFEDTIAQAFNNIGKQQEGVLSDSIKFATLIVENYEPIIDGLKVIVAGYGSYKAALILTAVAQRGAALATFVQEYFAMGKALGFATANQIAFNRATLANPYVLAASALIALATAVALFSDETTEATKAQERALGITERLNQKHAEETTKIQLLNQQISNESLTREQRNAKLKELIAISPKHFNALTLDNIATSKGAEAIRDYTKALETKLKLQANEEQILANNKRERDIRTGVLDEEFKPGLAERAKLFLEDSGFDEKKYKAATEKRKQVALQELKKENDTLIKEAAEGIAKRNDIVANPNTPVPGKPTKSKAVQDSAKEEKDARIRTFAEEIEEKKRMYELFNRWTTHYGTESAKEQFKDLISSGNDYVSYLDKEIARIEAMKDVGYAGKLSDTDKIDLDNLIAQRNEAKGGSSAIDQFKESLAEAREESATLTDYLTHLKRAQDDLNRQAPTKDVIDQKAAIAREIIDTQKQRKKLLSDFLISSEESEQSRLDIENHYSELRAELEERSQGEKAESYLKAIDLINKKESEELHQRKNRIREASEEYKALIKAVENAASSTGLFDQIKKQKDLVASLLASEGYSDAYMQEQRKLSDMQRAMYTQIAGAVGDLGEALQNVGGTVGDIGRALAGIASQGNNLVTVFDKNATATQKWGSAAQAVGNLISIVASSAKQRKDAEADYFRSVIAYQSEYNLMINEQIRLQGEAGDSVFVKDYAGRIKGAQDSLADATDKYQDALDKLDQGRAKTGQKNGIDWKAVGAGAVSGATIGGIAGAGVFSWATAAIGAVGGAIVGLIGGLKKKDKYAPLLEEYKDLVQVGADGVEYLNVEIAKILISTNRVDEETKGLLQNAIDLQEQMNEAKAVIVDIISSLAGQLGDSLRENLVGAFIAGTSAGEAMFQSLNKSLASFLEQMIFSQVFSKRMKQFETEMAQSLGEGGDGDVTDDYGRLFSDAGALGTQYFDMLNSAKEEAKKHGFDLWAKDSTTSDRAKGMTGAIQGMSQETASLLAGQFNALRISGADSASSLRQMLIYQANISRNSDYQKNLTLLVEINAGIKDLNKNPLRASGL